MSRYPLYPSPVKKLPPSPELKGYAHAALERLNERVKRLRSKDRADIDVVTEENYTASQIMAAVIYLLNERQLPAVTFICWKQTSHHIFVMYFTVR